tara:strand:+ start:405 stop:644 length:240 start_codon:yes stop_codon:yes gene_type:complete
MDKQHFYKDVTKKQEPTLEELDKKFIEKARQQKYDKINEFFMPKLGTSKRKSNKYKKNIFNKGGYVSVQDMEKNLVKTL